MKFARLWRSAALAGVLAVGAGRAEEPPVLPPSTTEAPAALTSDVARKAISLPPAASQRVFDQYLQTIDWHSRPKLRPAPAQAASKPADLVIQAGASQVPEVLPPALEPPVAPAVPLAGDLLNYEVLPGTTICVDGLLRGYYRNDQRIYWSGLESVYGGEGIFRPLLQTTAGRWTVSAQGEFFINQRYGSSILSDPQRDLYRTNFQVDQFDIFQLYGQVQYGDWVLRLGKTRTPFGNYQSPMFTNALFDAPFIRTDVIPWTETGAFLRWQPGPWSVDLAITNGEPNLDTNSSKAGISRIGYSGDDWTIGTSVKWQDGISSEYHKRYNNIVGVDYAFRFGRLVAYGEVTYDQYGFRRNFDAVGGNHLNLGVRSLYHRDVYSGQDVTPVHGIGHYVGLGFRGDKWLLDATFGSYFPQRLNIPAHDAYIHRAVMKAAYAVTPNFQIYMLGLVENVRPPDGVLHNDNPFALVSGMQLTF